MTENQQLLRRLSKLDSSAVSDALDSLQLKGVVTRLKQVTVPKKIWGQAVTVKLVPQDDQPSTRHLGTAAVEAATSDNIIVVEHCRDDVAGWGGNLSLAANVRGVKGVIIDGACRDADEIRGLDFPVYASAFVPTTARGRIKEQSFNEKIQIDQIEIQPGDFVLADSSGIVFIPMTLADEVLTKAEAIVENEAKMAKQILDGQPVSAVMGAKYENMLK